jgi:hypothetical protein
MKKNILQLSNNFSGQHWLGGKRMFFGIDFSHAPPQTLYERKTGIAPAIPSVVGVS